MRARSIARGLGPLGLPYPFVDAYLASLRTKSSDQATLDSMYDIVPAPASFAGLAPAGATDAGE
jgi:hypothetical protein